MEYLWNELKMGLPRYFALATRTRSIREQVRSNGGQVLIELLIAIGVSVILIPAIFSGIMSGREGRVQQNMRLMAISLAESAQEAARVIREGNWDDIAVNGVYHPIISGTTWALSPGAETILGFTRSITISDVYRDGSGNIADSGELDPSIKKLETNVAWANTIPSSVDVVMYLTRFANTIFSQTTDIEFNLGTLTQTQVTNVAGGEVKLANNNKAKWCSPEFSSATIDLPDGPPVAVSASGSSASSSIPNDVFVVTSPETSSSIKLAYLHVTADTDPPEPTLQGTFTLDASQYSSPGLVPSGIGIDNNFKTNDVKNYTSSSGNVYALIATDLPNKEVIAVQISNGVSPTYQDSVNKIYQYKTFFNTRIYEGNNSSQPNQDQAPFGYGGVTLSVYEDRGYLVSGGYIYVFDLSNIDSKNSSSGLDMLGCRIEIGGFDCRPDEGIDRKYSAGQTGTTWSTTTYPANSDCSDGGNVELHAANQLAPVRVGSNTYVMVADGAATNPELSIINVTSVPSNSSSPKINNSSCGRVSGGNSGWKRISSFDFNSQTSTQEAANSVYVRDDGNRVYMSSNGGIDGNHDGKPDSYQFYVIDTSNKSAPKFLSGTSFTGAQSGYYSGDSTNIQLFPRRSLTVLQGERAIVVGQDGYPDDGTEPEQYQVLNIDDENNPTYCAGLTFTPGFNDLVSVSEADLDNFVYMVANTNEKQLKIIQGGPDDGIYIDAGTFESQPYDAGGVVNFNRFGSTQTLPADTEIKYQVAVSGGAGADCSGESYTYVGPDGTVGTYFTDADGVIPFASSEAGYTNPGRCFRLKAYLSATNNNQTPVLEDFQVNFSP